MARFKVVCIDSGGNTIPAWVAEKMEQAGIDFVAQECKTSADLARHAAGADVVWNWGSRVITAENLPSLARCGGIIRTGSGTDNVPVEAATQLGIVVANTPEAHDESVSNHAIGLLFAAMRSIPARDRSVRAGAWDQSRSGPGWHLRGQTLGLVGFGHIARQVAKKMSGFEMTVLVHDPFISAEVMAAAGARPAALDELLAASHFISLHCPLTPATFHLIGERELKLMKPTAILVNTARGPVIDEPALVRALTEGWIAAAGLDVLEQEPAAPDNPLFKLDNVVLTPHIAGQSDEDIEACFRLSVESAVAMSQGRWPRSYVNRSVKPRLSLA